MPTETVEAPPAETKTETTPDPLSVSVGDLYGDALDKLQGNEPKPKKVKPAKDETKPEAKTEEKKETKAEAKVETKIEPPKSVLEAVTQAAKPTEAKTEDIPDALKEFQGKSDKEINVGKMRQVMEAEGKEKLRLLKQVETLSAERGKPDPKSAEKVVALEKERDSWKQKADELNDAVVAINITQHPDYIAKYVKGREAEVEKTVSLVKSYGGNVDDFTEALDLPEGKRRTAAINEALTDVDEMGRTRIFAKIDKIQSLDEEAADQRKNPQVKFEELEQKKQEVARQKQQEAETRKQETFQKVAKTLPSAHPLLQTVDTSLEGADEQNNAVKSSLERALVHFGPEANPEKAMEVAVKGENYDRVERMALDFWKNWQEAEKKLAEYDQAQPDFQGTGKPKTGDDKLSKSPGQLFTETMAKLSNQNED